QEFIDRRFYRESVDFRRTLMNFSRVVRTIIDMPELLRVLVTRTADLLHITHGVVYLREPDGTFRRTEDCYVPTAQTCQEECVPDNTSSPDEAGGLSLATGELGRLRNARTVSTPTDKAFSLLVPLVAPRMEGNELVGVLALGSRRSGQDYSREDRALLLSLADQAGTAIYVARLI
ncbi:MAG: GAF domain-containing protein, partial [Bosea sp.]|uniref:GAF domain-containing protein n=1 Tax=Bosea sp. (in: a-proteobacteria) TaxID=1871050 RepID=UPI0031FE591F|nr:GAF domain-containing protein [Bosea sp. (in: a-proteobacteria)]